MRFRQQGVDGIQGGGMVARDLAELRVSLYSLGAA